MSDRVADAQTAEDLVRVLLDGGRCYMSAIELDMNVVNGEEWEERAREILGLPSPAEEEQRIREELGPRSSWGPKP